MNFLTGDINFPLGGSCRLWMFIRNSNRLPGETIFRLNLYFHQQMINFVTKHYISKFKDFLTNIIKVFKHFFILIAHVAEQSLSVPPLKFPVLMLVCCWRALLCFSSELFSGGGIFVFNFRADLYVSGIVTSFYHSCVHLYNWVNCISKINQTTNVCWNHYLLKRK